MTNPSPGLPHPVRRVIPDRHAGSEFPGFTNQCGDYFLHVAHTLRRVVLRPPSNAASYSQAVQPMWRVNPLIVPSTAASPSDRAQGTSLSDFPELSNQCGELSRTVHTSSPDCAQNKNSSQHSPSVMRVSKCNGIRAHTHASTRRLCRPCLCFFYIFFINIILFYYWVTNRDFIDLFCHTPQT